MTRERFRLMLPEWFLRMTHARVLILFLFHALVFTASYVFAYLVRFEFDIPTEYEPTFRSSIFVIVAFQLLVGLIFGFYRGWWRYVGVDDVVRLVAGLTAALVFFVTLWYVGPLAGIPKDLVHTPRGVLLIDWAFSLLTLFGSRLAVRMARNLFRPAARHAGEKRVLIVGAGDAGEALAREIEQRPDLGLSVVGFIDDHRAKVGSQIRGIDVYGPISSAASIAEALSATEALIAIPNADGRRLREIIRHLAEAGLRFKTTPGIDQIVSDAFHVSQLRPVNVEDLLRRDRIELPGDPVRALVKGKRVMITGAGGTIASELAVQVMRLAPEKLILVERSEFALYNIRARLERECPDADAVVIARLVDICDPDIVDGLLSRERPHIVLHAAAHKHVTLGEENPLEYLRNNTLATRELVELCEKRAVERFVFVSTDKAINPSSVMGATKRAAEILLLEFAARASIQVTVVRFGNVIGSSGSVIPLFMEQIAAGGPVTVTHPEATRYFIRTSEAVSLVLQAATLRSQGQVLMFDMGEPLKIVDLARDLIRLSGQSESEIPIVFSGLQRGEKLFEDLGLQHDAAHATIHPQIVVADVPQPEPVSVRDWLDGIVDATDGPAAVAALRELVLEYQTPGAERPLAAPGQDRLHAIPLGVREPSAALIQ